jgi:hypothetical protein
VYYYKKRQWKPPIKKEQQGGKKHHRPKPEEQEGMPAASALPSCCDNKKSSRDMILTSVFCTTRTRKCGKVEAWTLMSSDHVMGGKELRADKTPNKSTAGRSSIVLKNKHSY